MGLPYYISIESMTLNADLRIKIRKIKARHPDYGYHREQHLACGDESQTRSKVDSGNGLTDGG